MLGAVYHEEKILSIRVRRCTDASIVAEKTAVALSSWGHLKLLHLKLSGWII